MSRKPASKKLGSADSNVEKAAKNIRKAEKMSNELRFDIKMPFELRPNHQRLVDLSMTCSTNVMIIDGPAGTAKTYCAAYVALECLKRRYKDKILYVRSIVESAERKMGSLPGEVEDKFMPWSIPLAEKLDEMLEHDEVSNLFDNDYVKCWPMNFLRGVTFKDNVVIIDEAQNLTMGELITAMTRFGDNCKLMIIGDQLQSDIGGKSGFPAIFKQFSKEKYRQHGIHTVSLLSSDIVRSPLISVMVEGFEEIKNESNQYNHGTSRPRPTPCNAVPSEPALPVSVESLDWSPCQE
jgi:phosphate starvation-inducible PhoH-like protein